MTLHDIALLARVRSASTNLGKIFASNVNADLHQKLTILLLDELANYHPSTVDPLAHEITMGMLEAFTPQELFDAQNKVHAMLETLDKHQIQNGTSTGRGTPGAVAK